MKKSIFLIAPLTLLISCTGTSEIFDDAYNETKAPALEKADENEGYADHIKNQEKYYDVKVEENASEGRTMDGLNPSYYGQGGYNAPNHAHNHNDPRYNVGYAGYNNWHNNNFNGGGWNSWGVCQYSCMTFFQSGRCWHVDRGGGMFGNNYGFYNGNFAQNYCFGGQYPGIVYGTNDPYAPNGWYGVGGDPYWGGYYGNGYYNNMYCGNGFYNNYYGYGGGWGSPYYGWGPYWGYNGWYFYNFNNNNNNWNNNGVWGSNNQDNQVASNNHHYGHRGGTNTGSNSQNNTNYEHTVHSPVQTNATPFPSYSDAAQLTSNSEISTMPSNTDFASKPATNVGTVGVSDPATPDHINTYSTSEKPGSFNSSKPIGNPNSTTVVNFDNKPANGNNSFSTGNTGTNTKPVVSTGNSTVSKGKPAGNQFAPTTVPSYSKTDKINTGNTNSGNTYSNPNKYGTSPNTNDGYTPTYTPSYGGGTTNSNNRRSNSGSSGRSYNSGNSSNRGGSGSNYSGNRSSSSSSGSSNRSSSGSSGTTGGSSRRR